MIDEFLKKLERSPSRKREQCSVCRTSLGSPTIELPKLPLTEILVDTQPSDPVGFIDQAFHVCGECGHGQLAKILDPSVLYGISYSYQTSKSRASIRGNEYFRDFIVQVIAGRQFENIIDIGCNDLYLLNLLKPYGNKLIGIDPQLATGKYQVDESRFTLIPELVENVDFGAYLGKGSSLFVSSHNLEHIEHPGLLLEKLFSISSPQDMFVFQFPGFETMIEDCRFDLIFHHHLHYFSRRSFDALVRRLGGHVITHRVNRPFWGSLLVAFSSSSPESSEAEVLSSHEAALTDPLVVSERFGRFAHDMGITRQVISECPQSVYGYGAPLSLATLLYHLGLDGSQLKGIIDDDPVKHGKFYLNLPAPIIGWDAIACPIEEASILVTGLNHAREIISKLATIKPKRVILPIGVI